MRAILTAFAAIIAFFTLASAACAQTMTVRIDQSARVTLPAAAKDVIVGNPSIADVALQGGNLLVVTGKTFGITNVIALDAERNVIQDQRVLVERDDRRTVNLMKGGNRYTLSCTPNCEPTLTIGDDKVFFETVKKHNSDKTSFSESSADSAGGNANSQ